MEKKYSKKIAALVFTLGLISAFNFLLAPFLHEIWHILFSLLHGYIPREIHWTWMDSGDTSLSMTILPSYIEVILLFVIFAYALHKGKRYLAMYFLGYSYFLVFVIIIYTIAGMMSGDYDFAMDYHNQTVVRILWYSFELFTIFLMVLKHYLLIMYGKQRKMLQKTRHSILLDV